ncbi:hypothetical protein BT63DRAFT_8850 [Microthyrium microscopicum]|uniref:Uncharacterized protein n=1 Tax=Microthyrium microscopicum TaxID=703497 RepID=A0A6A6UQ14_9PEZI|nr:hypothetical protein BT63DRAFT_8850 [Microthyrium microscopicum]
MNRRDYQASCAVCGGPADPDCASGCESTRLNMAIAQAETQWLDKWREKTREWVANHAISHVTNTFKAMKETRLSNYNAYIKALPYISIYEQYHGRPPLHPNVLQELRRQIHEADVDLRNQIDGDWRNCVVRYPEVLTYYYSMVNIQTPKDVNGPTNIIAPVPSFQSVTRPPIERSRSTTGTSSATKKTRRNSKTTSSIKGSEFSVDAIAKLLHDQNLAGHGAPTNHNMSNGHPGGLAGMSGMASMSSMAGMPGMSAMAGMTGLTRSSSKAGRSTPVQEGHPSRPSGKKRHSKDYMSFAGMNMPASGRATAPIPHAPYAPPGMGMPQSYLSGRYPS